MGYTAVAAAGLALSAYGMEQQQSAAKKAEAAARDANAPKPQLPGGAEASAAAQAARADVLARTAGGSLLSDPNENRRGTSAIGTVPGGLAANGAGRSLLGA